jgi:hypothetical protein
MISNLGTEGFYKASGWERLKLIAEMCNLSDWEPSFLSSISDRTRNVHTRDRGRGLSLAWENPMMRKASTGYLSWRIVVRSWKALR